MNENEGIFIDKYIAMLYISLSYVILETLLLMMASQFLGFISIVISTGNYFWRYRNIFEAGN